MPLLETKGAASAQGFGGAGAGASGLVTYIEDVFSTYLYTGTGANQTFNNGVDLSTKGGMVWIKQRSSPVEDWRCVDSARGITNGLQQNLTNAQQNWTGLGYVTSFNTNGFSIGTNVSINTSAYNYASWTFRKQPKFFDVVTWTGNAATPRTITHALGSVPGCIIVKKSIGTAEDWFVFHRSLGNTATFAYFLILNNTNAQDTGGYGMEKSTSWTSTTFSLVSAGGSSLNESGATYVAYLFAHNAGGFGLSGTDNVISCGSYTGVGSTQQDITLGYEPQWLLIKRVDVANSWSINDNMRGLYQNADNALCPNNANAEAATFSMSGALQPTATGFHLYNGNSAVNASGGTYIYIAIRRGPMKVPTSGTTVMNTLTWTGNGTSSRYISGTGFPTDLIITSGRSPGDNKEWDDRLRGWGSTAANSLFSNNTNAEAGNAGSVQYLYQDGPFVRLFNNASGTTYCAWNFRRAPNFFDEVCYTGDSTTPRNITHNLGAVPELILVKSRSNARGWAVYSSAIGAGKYLILNGTNAALTDITMWANTAPTSSVFTVGNPFDVNNSGYTYVAYLFATCAGVSKVGSYTGTGALQTINCGFTGGSRFVLIKRTDSTGDWYVYDSARGISSGNDPYLLLNDAAAEVTGTNYVDTTSVGFQVTAAAPAGLNANGGSFVFLAIA